MRIGPISPHGRGCAVGAIAVIAMGMLVGFGLPRRPPQTCGMYAWIELAIVVAKVSLGCLIGALAGFTSDVRRGMVLGGLIGVFAGPLISTPWNSPVGHLATGTVTGALVGLLSSLAGKATPIEDRIASGYRDPRVRQAPAVIWVAVKRGAKLGALVGIVLACFSLLLLRGGKSSVEDSVTMIKFIGCITVAFCAFSGSVGLGTLAVARALVARSQRVNTNQPQSASLQDRASPQ